MQCCQRRGSLHRFEPLTVAGDSSKRAGLQTTTRVDSSSRAWTGTIWEKDWVLCHSKRMLQYYVSFDGVGRRVKRPQTVSNLSSYRSVWLVGLNSIGQSFAVSRVSRADRRLGSTLIVAARNFMFCNESICRREGKSSRGLLPNGNLTQSRVEREDRCSLYQLQADNRFSLHGHPTSTYVVPCVAGRNQTPGRLSMLSGPNVVFNHCKTKEGARAGWTDVGICRLSGARLESTGSERRALSAFLHTKKSGAQ